MENIDDEVDNFKTSFKYYKRKNPKPDLSEVIDFEKRTSKRIQSVQNLTKPLHLPVIDGLLPVEDWKVYSLEALPGFYFICNPLRPWFQRYWAYRCIREFPCKPHICNLDAHIERSEDGNIWDESRRPSKDNTRKKNLMNKLRWVTLGYHHNWDTKHYSREQHAPFPTDLGYLSRYVIEALQLSDSFCAQAAIINYYHSDSTLAGHTDHSEFFLEAPLISFSFGQTAIFMVGGRTRAQEPVAMYLRNGDITIMSGESRLAYHAVPKIVEECWWDSCTMNEGKNETSLAKESDSEAKDEEGDESQNEDTKRATSSEPSRKFLKTVGGTKFPTRENSCLPRVLPDTAEDLNNCVAQINMYAHNVLGDKDFQPFLEYLKFSRVNMNVRQVFAPGQTFDDVDAGAS